ncbi:unnamed protein product [Mesocestoides corti]|uniref:FAR1 domain-containing protein n=1 Tax=Mesocestoides corti TaxID=53468 RepID=A0A0R3U7C1_MESCO|nr:unnamed protein product [Mesocestoides corti]
MNVEGAQFVSTGTDVTVDFLNIFTGKTYGTFASFATDMNSFMALSRTSYKKAKTLYFPEGSSERRTIVYRAMKLSCQHSACVVNNTNEFVKWFAAGSFETFHDFKHTLDLFSEETGSQFKVRNSVLFPPDTRESTTLVYKVVSLKCIHGGSYTSVAIRPRPGKTKCIGCLANITAKAKDGRLVVVRARLRHNHALIPRSADNEGSFEDYQFKFGVGGEEESGFDQSETSLVDRLEIVDPLLQRLRERVISRNNDPKWFSAFLDLMVDVDQITDDPDFPSESIESFYTKYRRPRHDSPSPCYNFKNPRQSRFGVTKQDENVR